MKTIEKFLQYGVSKVLADKAISAGLTVSQAKVTTQKNLREKYNLTDEEAKMLTLAVKRKPIDDGVIEVLLERSNYTCCICKGIKSSSYVIHHIEEYEISQNNSYDNLAVVCPNDHDLSHNRGLTLGITPKQLRKAKNAWEKSVELANVQRAANAIDVNDHAIDYINVQRIEELCLNVLGEIPKTSISSSLIIKGILNADRAFDEKYVRKYLSNGNYLFDYINSLETEHYKQLLQLASSKVIFEDLDLAQRAGYEQLKALEGKYCYFVGGVYAKRPALPITKTSQPVLMYYKRWLIKIEWILDPNYLISMSAIVRVGGKNLYIVYGLLRSVSKNKLTGAISVKASPLLIAQPKASIHRTPSVFYTRQYERYKNEDLIS